MGIGGREERERQMEEGESKRKREIGGREMGIGGREEREETDGGGGE